MNSSVTTKLHRAWRPARIGIALLLIAAPMISTILLSAGIARATEVVLDDGRKLKGAMAPIASMANVPKVPDPETGGPIRMILMVDDELRRTFVPKRQVREVLPDAAAPMVERFNIKQRIPSGGRMVKSIGPIVRIEPFDDFGRRIFTFNAPSGPIDVIQGVTLITPEWTKVEGITHMWDMRMATTAIPPETLRSIILKQIDPKDIEQRKKIARFYLQCDQYKQAGAELKQMLKDFPGNAQLAEDLTPMLRLLKQMTARRILTELKLRKEAAQHRLVYDMLQKFPSDNVSGEILSEVSEILDYYNKTVKIGQDVLDQLDQLAGQITDRQAMEEFAPIREEIGREMNINTLGRFASFRQYLSDPQLTAEEKLAYGISGWLIGSDEATPKLPVALSLYRVRNLVRDYVNEPIKLQRASIYSTIRSLEGASPKYVAALLKNMKPVMPLPPQVDHQRYPGLYLNEVEVMSKEAPVKYLVQLPPEYDPYRKYPTIISLHGVRTTPQHQIDWWAGAAMPGGWRNGQASRQGYIVIAPNWTVGHQSKYGYTQREQLAVIGTLQDACRYFSIDTDKVYLTGHSIGGDAAWDIGLAHPDLWAGVIPIVAQADKYVARYWENARYVPFYFISGEMDGLARSNNARDWDRYLRGGFDVTIVEYLGRGHEHFSDDVIRAFDWMGRKRRNFFPREFECVSMRQWDNRFWWVEMSGYPPRGHIHPAQWPPPAGTHPTQIKAKLTDNNGIYISSASSSLKIWLTPDMVNFDRRVSIKVNAGRTTGGEPDLLVMLDDVMRRWDMIHPFWAVAED